jgi:hypothetical protein
MPPQTFKPKNYFINESHELSVEEKTGGGPQLPILKSGATTLVQSGDPFTASVGRTGCLIK